MASGAEGAADGARQRSLAQPRPARRQLSTRHPAALQACRTAPPCLDRARRVAVAALGPAMSAPAASPDLAPYERRATEAEARLDALEAAINGGAAA
jgi:hypothetical protein